MSEQTAIPAMLIAGDTWSFTRAYDEHQSPTWAATAYLENKDGTITIHATASEGRHVFGLTAAETADKKAGRYRLRIRVTSGALANTIEEAWIDVAPNPQSGGQRDFRSFARRTLDAIEATLEGRASRDQLSMQIQGRSISRIPLTELVDWRDRLRNEVRVEEAGSQAGLGRYIKVRFSRG